MKRTRKQLNAISRAYRAQEIERQERIINNNGWRQEFASYYSKLKHKRYKLALTIFLRRKGIR